MSLEAVVESRDSPLPVCSAKNTDPVLNAVAKPVFGALVGPIEASRAACEAVTGIEKVALMLDWLPRAETDAARSPAGPVALMVEAVLVVVPQAESAKPTEATPRNPAARRLAVGRFAL